jgi:hypothetical protein
VPPSPLGCSIHQVAAPSLPMNPTQRVRSCSTHHLACHVSTLRSLNVPPFNTLAAHTYCTRPPPPPPHVTPLYPAPAPPAHHRKTIASDGIAGLYRGFNISCVGIVVYRGLYFGMYDSLKPVLLTGDLADNFLASFMLGWSITIGAGLASYPIDTVRRRMMMTSGQAVKYKSSLHCFKEVVAKEGTKSLFKGAGANILRAVAGAGVLSGYDKLQVVVFGKKYGSGE